MVLTKDSPDFDSHAVFLNGRLVQTALAANDTEGWVEILDLAALAPLAAESSEVDDDSPEPVELKTKRLEGKVEIRKIT